MFKVDFLQSQYKLNEHDHNVELSNNENYCLICYDQLDTVTKKQTKTCVNEKCNAVYHMACICEVNNYDFCIIINHKLIKMLGSNSVFNTILTINTNHMNTYKPIIV